MKKETLWIMIVCVVLFGVLFFFQQRNTTAAAQTSETVPEASAEAAVPAPPVYTPVSKGEKAETFTWETDFISVVFDTEDAGVRSLKLRGITDADGQDSEIIFRDAAGKNAFLLYWGEDLSEPAGGNWAYTTDGSRVVFTKTYQTQDGNTFTAVKTFEFRDGEYLFAVSVDIQGTELPKTEYAYTLAYEPQVGPEEVIQNNNYTYRRFYAGLYTNNEKVRRSSVRLTNNMFISTRDMKWLSVTSKYFTVIAVPAEKAAYKYRAVQTVGDGAQTDSIYVSVPATDAGTETTFYFYCGPQLKKYLGSYYSGTDNAWGLRGLNLDDAMESGSILGWLENILKWCLQLLHRFISNYGVCIIVLTIILKILTWPLQKKSLDASAKMSALAPMVEEIKKKYPENPQKQNAEMQALYQEYGVGVMGGCLPMLLMFLQFPILIAFYGLLNKHFELRGQPFIRPWISDLSLPDQVATLPFRIPLLGNQIHLLPLLYVITSILSMLYTQKANKNTQQQRGMWFLTWGMPIMFFFILYSAPSGLFVFWICQSLLSILQQFYTNRRMAKKGGVELKKVSEKEKKEPAAVLKYQEKLKKLEEAKAASEKQKKTGSSGNGKNGKKK